MGDESYKLEWPGFQHFHPDWILSEVDRWRQKCTIYIHSVNTAMASTGHMHFEPTCSGLWQTKMIPMVWGPTSESFTTHPLQTHWVHRSGITYLPSLNWTVGFSKRMEFRRYRLLTRCILGDKGGAGSIWLMPLNPFFKSASQCSIVSKMWTGGSLKPNCDLWVPLVVNDN